MGRRGRTAEAAPSLFALLRASGSVFRLRAVTGVSGLLDLFGHFAHPLGGTFAAPQGAPTDPPFRFARRTERGDRATANDFRFV